MLETKISAIPTYPRSVPRRTTYPLPSTPVATERKRATANDNALDRAREQARQETVSRPVRGSNSPASRLARSETRLMQVAIGFTVVVCALLVVYLAAYAHVAGLGIDQSNARVALRQKRLQNETLRAEYAALRSPGRIVAGATGQQMVRKNGSVCYIASSQAQPTNTQSAQSTTDTMNGASPKVASRGTTGENRTVTRDF